MVGLTPGQRTVAAGEATAAVAHGQGGPLGGGDDPGGAADVQGLGRGPAQDRGEQLRRGPQPFGQTALAPGIKVAVVTAGVVLSLMATEFVVAAGVGVAAVAGKVVEGDVGGGAMPGDQDPG